MNSTITNSTSLSRGEAGKRGWHLRAAVSLILLAFAMSSGANVATCIPATADGPGLQGCLDNTAPGDTIELRPGIYTGPPGIAFLIDKSLTIRGTAGVVLSGGNAGHVVVIAAPAGDPVTLEDLTVADGNATVFDVGGGILAASDQVVTLNNVTVQNSEAALGGGMWTSGSETTVNRSTFTGNSALIEGGALAHEAFGAYDLSIEESEFAGNEAAELGGAVVVRGVGPFNTYDIRKSTFTDNGAAGTVEGGAIFIAGIIGSGSISGSTFQGNRAAGFGGAISIALGDITLEKNTFAENHSDFVGGGVYVVGSEFGDTSTNVTLLKNFFYRNNADVFGGGFFAELVSDNGTTTRGSSVTTHGNHFTENTADTVAGALIFASSNVSMEKDDYNFNTASSAIGGLALVDVVANPLAGVPAGSLSRILFNHNEGQGNPDSLYAGGFGVPNGSPDVTYDQIKIAGQDAFDCFIEGEAVCPR